MMSLSQQALLTFGGQRVDSSQGEPVKCCLVFGKFPVSWCRRSTIAGHSAADGART